MEVVALGKSSRRPQASELSLGCTRIRPRRTSSEPRNSVRALAAEAGSTSGADMSPPVPPPEPPLKLPPLKPLLPWSLTPLPRLPRPEQLLEIELPIIVTAPVSAIALPQRILAELSRLTLASARIFPSNNVPEPSVAELPT